MVAALGLAVVIATTNASRWRCMVELQCSSAERQARSLYPLRLLRSINLRARLCVNARHGSSIESNHHPRFFKIMPS